MAVLKLSGAICCLKAGYITHCCPSSGVVYSAIQSTLNYVVNNWHRITLTAHRMALSITLRNNNSSKRRFKVWKSKKGCWIWVIMVYIRNPIIPMLKTTFICRKNGNRYMFIAEKLTACTILYSLRPLCFTVVH